MNIHLSEKQLMLLDKWIPDEPFSDIYAMQLVIPLPRGTFEGAMSVRRKPRNDGGLSQSLLLPRLAMKRIYVGPQPTAMVPYSGGCEWLRAVALGMPDGFAHDLMRTACWKLSCRVTRGSRERTQLAKVALAQYRAAWPSDSRLQHQPGATMRAMQAA